MDNPTITGPETPAPALTETTAASLQPEIQPAPVADSTKPDNVVETTQSGSAATAATGDNDQASENVQKPPEALPPEPETPGEYDDFSAYEEMMRSGEATGQQQGASVSTAQSASPATAPAQAQTEGQNIQTPASSDTAESSVASRETADATTTPETRKPDSVAAETQILPPEPSAAGAAAATAATDVFPASQDDWNAFAEDLSRPPSPASTQSQETSGDVPEPASAAAPVPEPASTTGPGIESPQTASTASTASSDATATLSPVQESTPASAPEQPASVQDSTIQPPPVTGTGEKIARPETDTTEKAAETADTGEISASPDSTSSASAASESPAENNVSAHDPETATSATPAGTDNTAGSGTAAGTEKPGAGPAATPDAGSKADALPDTPAPASALLDRFRGFFSRRPKPQPADTPAASSAETVQEAKPQTAASSVQDVDGIVYGPRRPDSTAPENLDEIIKSLKWDTQPDNTVLYRLDDEPAFRDLGSRLEMVDGASQDDRKVLAALAVATKFYGGVIELTGSDEFKQKAMHLIVANNLEVRMKLPDQRAMLEKLRQERGRSQDTVVSHIPTPDLNRQTQTPVPPATAPVQAAPQPQTTTATATATSAASTPAAPPSPPQSGETTASASSRPQPPQSETPVPGSVDNAANAEDEAAPGKLRQGESVTAVLTNYGRAEYVKGKGESFFVELSNRSGRHLYWGQGLEELVKQCHKGEAVTLTLNGREEFTLPGDDRPRIRNKWSMTPVSCGITVPHERPEQGQRIQAYPAETFRQVMAQIRQGWPELTQDMRLPDTLPQTLYLGEDRQPVSGPDAASQLINVTATPPEKLAPVLGSLDKETRELNLLLVRGA
ncbi:hypothetical protein M8W81_005182, partial [Salmonella enterica]|nr:hypothetical protein [Salmonella enterica]EJF6007830.1 hypothetical protein [Salmonella enterica]EJF6165185.1 hypothetical protein [Salmonella enterica]